MKGEREHITTYIFAFIIFLIGSCVITFVLCLIFPGGDESSLSLIQLMWSSALFFCMLLRCIEYHKITIRNQEHIIELLESKNSVDDKEKAE